MTIASRAAALEQNVGRRIQTTSRTAPAGTHASPLDPRSVPSRIGALSSEHHEFGSAIGLRSLSASTPLMLRISDQMNHQASTKTNR